jgi:transposase InsO family protein
MLRSHSSAMIPPVLRQLARQPSDDVLLVCPGIVYRRDAIDWQHTGTPYTSWAFTDRTRASGLVPSMGPIGDSYDNAMIGAFCAVRGRSE